MAEDLGDRKYLFLDYGLVQQQGGLGLRVNPARKRDVVVKPERTWEMGLVGWPSIDTCPLWINFLTNSLDIPSFSLRNLSTLKPDSASPTVYSETLISPISP